MKYKFIVLFFLCGFNSLLAQVKHEREFRIKKKDFPTAAHTLIKSNVSNAKKLKFYKEIDSLKISYEAKFKKDKLWYSIEFNEEGTLEDIEITIKTVDIPNETHEEILKYLSNNFSSFKIKKIQQQYVAEDPMEKTFKNAFQNLMIPSVNYELIIAAKKENGYEQFEILFNAEGVYLSIRKSLPPNYDHVLY
ncbi:hypothetical protein Celal_1049 [Cellulophaga algicola DSM 14237]|uniref:Beta-lactamase-inhibitor-like PepSY-like domain-containing protein n=1 Tax=Cellulophaga algicola (strain DSM 14237 / IC166 / ACAM 630) TaxID=688270 RepID=E6X563_CELAD|nr:hypothetical protein [Cellulophaga algicola]ADV48374.1 hypothetical protein Celal_1049 [Cellulophaga algicola DSM 14237]